MTAAIAYHGMSEEQLYGILRQYQNLGIPILPIYGIDPTTLNCLCSDGKNCKAKGKHPNRVLAPNGVKNATLNPDILLQFVKRNTRGNWGAACGTAKADGSSGTLEDGSYLFVLDIDKRSGGFESLEDLEAKNGKIPSSTVTALSGGGGIHYYFKSKTKVKSRTFAPGIDLKSTGGYVLIEPSLHHSGQQYRFDAAAGILDTPLSFPPGWVLGDTTDAAKERPKPSGISARDTFLGEAFSLAGMAGDVQPSGNLAVHCPWFSNHSDGRGNGGDTSTILLPPTDGSTFANFHCSHNSCQGIRKYEDVLKALPADAVLAARVKYPFRPQLIKSDSAAIKAEVVDQFVPATVEPAAADPIKEIATKLAWRSTKFGNVVLPDLINCTTILTYDPRWRVDGKPLIRYDGFAQQVIFTAEPPWHPDDKGNVYKPYYQDTDTWRLKSWFRRYYDFGADDSMCYQAANLVAHKQYFHPVRDYMEALTWDGVGRLDSWLTKYLGVEASDYARDVGAWWLISGVARIFKPGCKADHVLILEGKQGARKSTALRTLCFDPAWFTDTPFEIGTKDAYLNIRGRLIVELAELDSMNRSDSARAKAFFSSPEDSFRPPYGRETVTLPRQCIFAGTVNHNEYLKDETGNRRYWPVMCERIDIAALARDREQLWAEAVARYRAGDRWWPDSVSERERCEDEQINRAESDAWQTLIAEFTETMECKQIMASRIVVGSAPNGYLTTSDILGRAILLKNNQWDRSAQIRIGKILASMGWTKHRFGSGDDRCYGFTPGYKLSGGNGFV